VYVGECTGAGSLLLDPRVTGGLAQHPTLSNENDVAVREFLLELTGESARWETDYNGTFQLR
jgi:hypothetical protein